MTIHNTGPSAVPAWQLHFTLPHGQRLVRGWTSGWRQDGNAVQAGGGALPSGATVSTGFDATYQEATALPALFRLNGKDCQAEMTVAGTRAAQPSTSAPVPVHTAPQRPTGTTPGSDAGGGNTPDSDRTTAKTAKKKQKEKKEKKEKSGAKP